jgi:hypothetical protein
MKNVHPYELNELNELSPHLSHLNSLNSFISSPHSPSKQSISVTGRQPLLAFKGLLHTTGTGTPAVGREGRSLRLLAWSRACKRALKMKGRI